MKVDGGEDISVQNFKRHQAGVSPSPPGRHILEFWISIISIAIASLSTIAGIIIFGDSALSTGIFAVFFALRQISRHIQFYVLAGSLIYHIGRFLYGLNPSGSAYDEGFLAFGSAINIVVLLPWSVNVYIILYQQPRFSSALEALGSIGSAALSGALAFLYFSTVTYYHGMSIVYPQEYEIPFVLGALSAIEAVLFVLLMAKGR